MCTLLNLRLTCASTASDLHLCRLSVVLPTQCEAKKRDEYRATSELSGAHFAAPTSYMEARTLEERNR